jgi:hypothetical protein
MIFIEERIRHVPGQVPTPRRVSVDRWVVVPDGHVAYAADPKLPTGWAFHLNAHPAPLLVDQTQRDLKA